jgi:glycosyltransferase involved in cell wall biosynthesis
MVAGRQAPAALIALCQRHGITLIQDPPEIEAVYAASDLLLVPLRIGGGTRIKILEAFGFGRPVVTTTIGAEGLDLDDGEHALFADTPEAFAQACRRVLGDEALAARLVSAARGLLQQRFSAEEIGKAILAGYTMARGGAGQ